jgi:hypothetical protein
MGIVNTVTGEDPYQNKGVFFMKGSTKVFMAAISIPTLLLLGAGAARANEKISNLGDNEIMAACVGSQPQGVDSTSRAIRTERQAICFANVKIEERGTSQVAAIANAEATAKRLGVGGSISTMLEAGASKSYISIIAERSWTKSLTDYCRESVTKYYGWHWLTNGRIFVAEGGFACHKGSRF